jgi:hypothetical protein
MAKRQGCSGVCRGRDLRGQRSGARVDGEVERTDTVVWCSQDTSRQRDVRSVGSKLASDLFACGNVSLSKVEWWGKGREQE